MMTPRGIFPVFFCWYLMKSYLTYLLLWLPPRQKSHFLILKQLSPYGKILLYDCISLPFLGHFIKGILQQELYLQCTTSSESLFNSYNLMASFSSSWQDMVHGSPEMKKQANKWHFPICQSQSTWKKICLVKM